MSGSPFSIIALVILLGAGVTGSEAPPSEEPLPRYLEPCIPVGGSDQLRLELARRIQANLDLEDPYALDRGRLAFRMLVHPGWEGHPERVVSLAIPEYGHAVVWSTKAVTGISGKNLDESTRGFKLVQPPVFVRVHRSESTLDRRTAKSIRETLLAQLQNTTFGELRPSTIDRVVIHGTRYEFYAYVVGHGLVCGQATSPDDGSRPRQLVLIGENLEAYASSSGPKRKTALDALRGLTHEQTRESNNLTAP